MARTPSTGAIVAISANDATAYPDDAPDPEVARAYGAACAPDFFLYGPDRRRVYRGPLDGSRPRQRGARHGK